jgi:hypothetical protein
MVAVLTIRAYEYLAAMKMTDRSMVQACQA